MHFETDEIYMFRARTTRKNVRYQIMHDVDKNQKIHDEFVKQLIQKKNQQ